ncbi:hypothetical protein GWI33_001840 [Rhynchophorus ferrugineus]|uniref:Uncharacterized protein n=1 Tax=Rhynchophorus ferrugineus TaxID=354439 RepID=A0A834IQ49_RHYFE|nr:hypothetical protein GWI33_001840 [Rhynchophorus ferrugineus]
MKKNQITVERNDSKRKRRNFIESPPFPPSRRRFAAHPFYDRYTCTPLTPPPLRSRYPPPPVAPLPSRLYIVYRGPKCHIYEVDGGIKKDINRNRTRNTPPRRPYGGPVKAKQIRQDYELRVEDGGESADDVGLSQFGTAVFCCIRYGGSFNLALSDYLLFPDLKGIVAGKKFSSNEEVIAETEAYFETKDKSYYKNDIEKLEGHYNQRITLEGNYVE